MNDAQRLARLVYVLVWIGIAAALLLVLRGAVTGAFTTRVDPETGTAGLLVETDRGTGCQYIVTPWGGIVPRTGPDGRAICGLKR
ncbi:hypothetical protein [Lichenibacterium ramalinae]|uniref:Uncharacterized protein n=1 Tax=Lichenibacterium ramalinae TaxID=2316527 RepID=A0A4Q2R8J8_9HYPH|nr:hypothetical protein [Lichenibacterium ramalinae]RYB02059.1 hypothetical protein D3272_23125 [Lichenibacterium ramalinae]